MEPSGGLNIVQHISKKTDIKILFNKLRRSSLEILFYRCVPYLTVI